MNSCLVSLVDIERFLFYCLAAGLAAAAAAAVVVLFVRLTGIRRSEWAQTRL